MLVLFCRPLSGKVEGRRACCRWRASSPAFSIAGWVHSSTMATFPAPATSNAACGCRDRNAARATVGEEFPICTLSVMQRVPNSTVVHGSASPPAIPDGRLSRVRFWPRLCTPFVRDSPSCPMGGLSRSLTYAPPRDSFAVPSSSLSHGQIPSSMSGVPWRSSGPPSAQSPFTLAWALPTTRVTSRVTSEDVTPPS
jgi:hypothetical protein